jgi:hypothetical protein
MQNMNATNSYIDNGFTQINQNNFLKGRKIFFLNSYYKGISQIQMNQEFN